MEVDIYIAIGTFLNSSVAVGAIWYANAQSNKSFEMLKLNMDLSFELIKLKAELELSKMKESNEG